MPPKDSIHSTSRLQFLKALRSRIGGLLRFSPGHRKWKMRVLETEHLVLREFDQNDLRDIAAWEQLSDGQSPEERAREFLDYCFREYRDRGIGPWGIESKATKAVVGNCGFPHIAIRDQCGEVNCYIAPQYRGRGFATEALKALFEFGFRDLCLHRIQARCELTNLISQSLAQKAGMRFEGFIEHPLSPTVSRAKQKMFVIFRKEFHTVRASQPPSWDKLGADF